MHDQNLTVGGFRDWLLSDEATAPTLAALSPGVTPEMAAAVSKISRLQDLMVMAAKCSVVTRFRNTIGLPGRLSVRLQPNHPTDDIAGAQALADSSSIRRAALTLKVPYYTTMAGAAAATEVRNTSSVRMASLKPAPASARHCVAGMRQPSNARRATRRKRAPPAPRDPSDCATSRSPRIGRLSLARWPGRGRSLLFHPG